jgi:hypothetical protein
MNPASKVSPKTKVFNGGRTNQYGENRVIAGKGGKPSGNSKKHP